ncbi:MAG: response regulator [Chthoniobacterales bacterium]
MSKVILPRTNIVRSFNQTRPSHLREPEDTAARAPIPMPMEHSERVLLLEDEAQTNFILREYLESLGYQVVAVANGVDGLKEVMRANFELVICDMMMPKLPGDMFYLAVQKTRPELCNRFVFITGHQLNPTVDAFIEKTHSAILVKPFRLQQLEATLEGILSRFPKKVRPITLSATPVIERLSDTMGAPTADEKTPSMVSKALKMVGFGRNGEAVSSVEEKLAEPAKPAASSTKVTRRIPHLANAPVMPSKPQAPAASTAKVTRRIPAPPSEGVEPKITRRVSQAENIIRVKHLTPADAPKPVTTRKIAAPVAAPQPTPKPVTTRKIVASEPAQKPVTTRKIAPPAPVIAPKVTAKIAPAKVAPAKAPAAKTTIKVAAKKTAPAPKVTSKVSPKPAAKTAPKTTAKISPKVTAKVSTKVPAKAAAKMTSLIPAPLKRSASAKKSR